MPIIQNVYVGAYSKFFLRIQVAHGNDNWWVCSGTKHIIPVVRFMIGTCGGTLAYVIGTFHFAYLVRKKYTACPISVSLCRTFFRQRRKRS